MKCMAEMNGLVFLKVAAYAALSGKDFSNKARFFWSSEGSLSHTCFQLQLFKPNLVLSADLFSLRF